MDKWIVPCNLGYYNVVGAASNLKRIDWKQSLRFISVGDEVYIYVGKPISAIKYKCVVTKVNLSNVEIDDSEYVVNGTPYQGFGNYMELEFKEIFDDCQYSLETLRSKGLRGNIQSQRHAKNLVD